MKWFKHSTSNYRNNFIQHLIDECGHSGPFIYYTLLEMCAEQLEPEAGKKITEEDCRFTFRRSVLCQNTRSKWGSVRQVLGTCQAGSEIQVEYKSVGSQNLVQIFIPKLAKLLTSDQKKSRHDRDSVELKSRLDKDKEKDKDTDTDKDAREDEEFCNAIKKQNQVAKNPNLVHDTVSPTAAFEARFKNYQDPKREEFMAVITTIQDFAPEVRGLFNRQRFVNEAMQTFATAEEFAEFGDQLVNSLRKKKPKTPAAYASAIWRDQVTKNRLDPKFGSDGSESKDV